MRYGISNEYFEWLCDCVCAHSKYDLVTFDKLLSHLHDVEFTYTIPKDKNRATDGIDLRWRFTCERDWLDIPECLDGPCSVLEMMVALALRAEETIMDDPNIGNRTGQWFWGMIVNLGLGSMIDRRYDKERVDMVLERFLNRDYEADGRGGLFTLRHCDQDVRDFEIWRQLCYYLDEIM